MPRKKGLLTILVPAFVIVTVVGVLYYFYSRLNEEPTTITKPIIVDPTTVPTRTEGKIEISPLKETVTPTLTPTKPAEKTSIDTALVPGTEYLGNDLKKTDNFKTNDESMLRCPEDETTFFDTKDVLDNATYAIMVKKCRSEQEAIEQFDRKTSSQIFSSTTLTYGDASAISQSEDATTKTVTIKYRVGIYYVDVLGRNKSSQQSVVEDLAQKVADYLGAQ